MDVQYWATALFALAILHTFASARFRAIAHRYPEGSAGENLFHLLGEPEVVMLAWAAALFLAIAGIEGGHGAIEYVESLDYREPQFVFVIMTVCATKPIVHFVDKLIRVFGSLLQIVTRAPASITFLFSALGIGPLLGSFITEPAAMTVIALVLLRQFFERGISRKLKYAIIGTLFVGVSIGGVLTPFAAPPVLMVAGKWGWDVDYMLRHFGWKAVLAVFANAFLLVFFFRREISAFKLLTDSDIHGADAPTFAMPWWVTSVHLLTLAFTVATAHHPDVFFGGFMLFLGFWTVTKEFQDSLRIREALLVGGFLAGLVTLGGLQEWWLTPLLARLSELPLYLGAICLTAVTDNAALTFLGSQVEGLTESMKTSLVAGAVVGGGLTVIANAPNPAGYSLLNPTFEGEGRGGISPPGLFLAALPPTIVAAICFWFLPNL